jgi:hypothetical protein
VSKPRKELKNILSEKPTWDIDEIFRLFDKRLKEKSIYDQKYNKGKAKFFVKELYESYGVEESKELVECLITDVYMFLIFSYISTFLLTHMHGKRRLFYISTTAILTHIWLFNSGQFYFNSFVFFKNI